MRFAPTAVVLIRIDFQINITEKGIVQGFNVIEQDGQKGGVIFSNVDLECDLADRCARSAGRCRGRRPKSWSNWQIVW
ncbi:hypothetical protein O9993_12730 [Vibrio lentus]|nr:hypothetical protein [Vibrio lentus]